MPDRLPPPRFSWSKLSKTAAFWLIVLLIPVVLVELTSNRGGESSEVAYFDFNRELDRDNVNAVEITQGQDPEVMAAALRHVTQQAPPSAVVIPGLLDGMARVNRLARKWLEEGRAGCFAARARLEA